MNAGSSPSVRPVELIGGLGFTEGPVLRQDGTLVVTSVDTGRVITLSRDGDMLAVADAGPAPNGAAENADGALYIAQCGASTPVAARTRRGVDEGGLQLLRDGRSEWCTTNPTSPNDVCVGPDGCVYLTDPTRPLGSKEGRLWRWDPATQTAELLAETGWYPNGIGFGHDPHLLYVADTDGARLMVFDLLRLHLEPEVATPVEHGRPDGFTFDIEGNFVIAVVALDSPGWGRIQVRSPSGDLLEDHEITGHRLVTNIAIDSVATAIVTAADTGSVLRLEGWERPGLPLYPFRSPADF